MLADYDRVVVTCSTPDGAVYVLRPPGQDPRAILRAARLVLPEGPYAELAGQLGLPASWPVVLADYDRVVVTCRPGDDAVYVLRPPGQDPRVILRAARLVLPEGPYGELADQLGVPGWLAGGVAGCPRRRAGGGGSWPARAAGRGGPGPRRPARRGGGARAGRLWRSPVPQRFDQRGHVPPVLGCQLVDAGDQEFPVPVARVLRPGRGLVVVVQSGGLGRGGADRGDRHVQAPGERVDGGGARRPAQVPCGGEGVEGGPGQAAAAGGLAVGPAPLAQPLLNQALQRVERGLRRRRGGRLRRGGVGPVPRQVRRHDPQPSPSPR